MSNDRWWEGIATDGANLGAADAASSSTSSACDCSEYEAEVVSCQQDVADAQSAETQAQGAYDSATDDFDSSASDLRDTEAATAYAVDSLGFKEGQVVKGVVDLYDALRGDVLNGYTSLRTLDLQMAKADRLLILGDFYELTLMGEILALGKAASALSSLQRQLQGVTDAYNEWLNKLPNKENPPPGTNQELRNMLVTLTGQTNTALQAYKTAYANLQTTKNTSPPAAVDPVFDLQQIGFADAAVANSIAYCTPYVNHAGDLSDFDQGMATLDERLSDEAEAHLQYTICGDAMVQAGTDWASANAALQRAQWDSEEAQNALENCEASPTCDPGEPNPPPSYDCTGQSNTLASAQAVLQAADDDLQRCQDALSTAQDNLDAMEQAVNAARALLKSSFLLYAGAFEAEKGADDSLVGPVAKFKAAELTFDKIATSILLAGASLYTAGLTLPEVVVVLTEETATVWTLINVTAEILEVIRTIYETNNAYNELFEKANELYANISAEQQNLAPLLAVEHNLYLATRAASTTFFGYFQQMQDATSDFDTACGKFLAALSDVAAAQDADEAWYEVVLGDKIELAECTSLAEAFSDSD
jgi:hypothetical protein